MELANFHNNTLADGYSDAPEHREAWLKVPRHETHDYALITAEIQVACGLQPYPVRLANGRHHAYGGFGVAHIISKHGHSLASWDYFSVQDFVDHTAQTFDAIYSGKDRRFLLVSRHLRNPTMNRVLVIEERKSIYTVVTGWLVSAARGINGTLIAEQVNKNGVLVWECRAPHLKGTGIPSPQKGQVNDFLVHPD